MSAAMTDFDGKTIVVLGGSRGIGRATARLLANRGASMIVVSRDLDACNAVAQTITADGGRCTAMRADATDAEQVAELFAQIRTDFGGIHGAFNNAGKILGFGKLTDASPAAFDETMRLNTGSVFFALHHELALMRETGGGSIVINAALAGVKALPAIGVYGAAKAAAIHLGQVAAREAGQDAIRVNTIAPGYIGTDAWMAKLASQAEALSKDVPLGRIGEDREVAEVVAWLLGDASSYVSGAVIPVDGGLGTVI